MGLDDNTSRKVLSGLDQKLLPVLMPSQGKNKLVPIRLLRVKWLIQIARKQPGYILQRRQDLEELEEKQNKEWGESGAGEAHRASLSPLLQPHEAVHLINRAERCVGALTYGWLTMGHPDPEGERVREVVKALKRWDHIEALFWDYASLFQDAPPPSLFQDAPSREGPGDIQILSQQMKRMRRTDDEKEAFDMGLKKMAYLYASAVGTTVLQLKAIPAPPDRLNRVVYLCDLKPKQRERRNELLRDWHQRAKFTTKEDTWLKGHPHNLTLTFHTHKSAEEFVAEVTKDIGMKRSGGWHQVCEFATLCYNEQSYDGEDSNGRPKDNGRGWYASLPNTTNALLCPFDGFRAKDVLPCAGAPLNQRLARRLSYICNLGPMSSRIIY